MEWFLFTLILSELLLGRVLTLKRRLSISEQNFETLIKSLNQSELKKLDENGNSLLHEAAEKGYVNSVELLCRLNLNVNEINSQQKTPLHLAASNGNTDIIEVLVQNGAIVDSRDGEKRTPLYLASIDGHLEVIKALVHHGADIEATRDNGATGLYQASFNGHLSIVENFVKMSPGLIHKTKNTGASALYVAAFAGQLDVLRFLLSKGADIDQPKLNGETALTIASKKGLTEVVTFLLANGAKKDLPKYNGVTALYSASESGRLDVVKVLLSNNVDVNKATSAGEAPLYVACVNGYTEIARLLLEKQANPNLAGQNDFSPLHVSVESGDLETVNNLISFHASVNVRSGDGLTPLMIAATVGHMEIVESLMECEEHGCPMRPNIDAVNHEGESALYLATEKNHKEIIEYLLRHGAMVTPGAGKLNAFFGVIQHSTSTDIVKIFFDTVNTDFCSMRDGSGNTPLHFATMNTEGVVFIELIKRDCYNDLPGESKRTPLFLAALHGNSLQVRLLLKQGANPNSQALLGETPLYIAAQRGHISVMEQLLQAGANPNHATSREGATPLFEAARHGYRDVVEMLLNAGADVNSTTLTDKASMLCVAMLFGYKNIGKLLLSYDVNVNHVDSDGENALFLVAQHSFYPPQSGFIDTMDDDAFEMLEMLITSGINVTHVRNDNLNAYQVAEFSGNHRTAQTLLTTGHFKAESTTQNPEHKSVEPEWDIAAAFDITSVVLVGIVVVVVACMPYAAFKISCILDDKDASPYTGSQKKTNIKKQSDGEIENRETQNAKPGTDSKTHKRIIRASVNNHNEGKKSEVDEKVNRNNQQDTSDNKEDQGGAMACDNIPIQNYKALPLSGVAGMMGMDEEFQMKRPGQGNSFTVIYNTVKVYGKDSDLIQTPQMSREEEESFHNSGGGGNVNIEGFTPYAVLCGIKKHHNFFVEYLPDADKLAGSLFQDSVISQIILTKIQDERHEKSKLLLRTLLSIQASKWAWTLMNHLEEQQSPLYDAVIKSCKESEGEMTNAPGVPLVEEQE